MISQDTFSVIMLLKKEASGITYRDGSQTFLNLHVYFFSQDYFLTSKVKNKIRGCRQDCRGGLVMTYILNQRLNHSHVEQSLYAWKKYYSYIIYKYTIIIRSYLLCTLTALCFSFSPLTF